MRAAAAAVRRVHSLGLEIRAGIHTGEVEIDGAQLAGVGVHLAARVMAQSGPGQVLVSATVRELMAGSGIDFVDFGVHELKGFAEGWRLFLLDTSTLPVPKEQAPDTGGVGRVPSTGAEESPALPFPGLLGAGSRTSYVGREELLGELAVARSEAMSGGCRAVFLSGEPGVGKTRTAAEVAKAAFDEGALVLFGRCDEGIGVPYQPFAEALEWYVSHGHHPVLGRHPGELIRLQPLLTAPLDGLADPVRSDPRSEEYLLFEATRSWLVELCIGQPLVIVLDDLHWASKPVLLLLAHVLRGAVAEGDRVRMLVIATYRNTELGAGGGPLAEVTADMRRLPGVVHIALDGLTADEVAEFVAQAAERDLDDEVRRFARTIHAETEGNPFFVREVLRHLVETGAVQSKRGRWEISGGAPITVPDGVRDVIGRRLGRLSSKAHDVLTFATVIGRDFDVRLLSRVSGLGEDEVLDVLDEALSARLVDETGPDHYRFAHALVQATLAEAMSASRRVRVHLRAGEAIEQLRPADVVALARHFREARSQPDARSRAVRYGLAAAQLALEARAPGDAEIGFVGVLDVLDGADSVSSLQRCEALCGLGEAQRDQGDHAFRETLLEAASLARAAGSVPLLVRAALANSRGLPSVLGGIDSERVTITEAALDAVGPEPSAERARLLAHLAAEIAFSNDNERRLALSDEAEIIARDLKDPALLAWVLNRTGYVAFAPDRIERLLSRGEEATVLSDAEGDPTQRVLARFYWSGALLIAGQVDRFREVTAEMLTVSADAAPTFQWFALIAQARLGLIDGRFADVEAINNEALELAQRLGEPDGISWWGAVALARETLRGNGGSLADTVGAFAQQHPDSPAWTVSHAVLLAYGGSLDETAEVLERTVPDPDALVHDVIPFMATAWLAVAPFYVENAPLATRVAKALSPYRGYWAHTHTTVVGPITLYLAMCAATTHDFDTSSDLYDEALRTLEETRCYGVLPWAKLTYAEMLRRRGSVDDHAKALDVLASVQQSAIDLDAPALGDEATELSARIIHSNRNDNN
ncbi:MAG: hypothetical protein NVS3B21_22970 [Acidimicrobiales bacterium]